MKIQYNRLPPQLTLSPNFATFRKLIHIYNFNKKTVLPARRGNSTYSHIININNDNINNCIDTN